MEIRNANKWGRLDGTRVAAFEVENGIELPDDFRAFLLEHHGGVPDPSFYWVVRGDWGSEIENIYGFGPDGYRLQQFLDHRESLEIGIDLLPIGDDGCCNLLCLGVSGPRRGQVIFVDHELAPAEAQRERVLASSFEEFLASLRPGPDY